MEDDILLNITNSIEEKLGKDESAKIADDIGLLISENEKTKSTIAKQGEHIDKLKADKEKLVLANGNLLKQVPMGTEEKKKDIEEKEPSPIKLSDAFTDKGMFKK